MSLKQSEWQIIETRVIKLPRDKVFELFTTPKHVDKWWGPNGWTLKTEKLELKPGGRWKGVMISPDGEEFPNLSIYREVVIPEKLVYEHGSDENTPNKDRFVSTITFENLGNQTKVTVQMVFMTKERFDEVKGYAVEGLKQTINNLEDYINTSPFSTESDH